MTTLRTHRSSSLLRATGCTMLAAVLSAATLLAALSPAAGSPGVSAAPAFGTNGRLAIVDLPAVHVTGRRADAATTVAELPPVFVVGRRSHAMAIVDLPRVVVVARRGQDADPVVLARQE